MQSKLIAILLIGITLGFAISRFFVPVHGLEPGDIYKDMAHVWIGLLIGISLLRPRFWFYPVGLTLIEIIAFFTRS